MAEAKSSPLWTSFEARKTTLYIMSTNEYNTGYSHVLSLKRLHASITPLGRVFGCENPYPHHCVFHTVPLPPPHPSLPHSLGPPLDRN